jgi:hypothetical protein
MALSFIKPLIRKRHDNNVYKNNHPMTRPQVVNVLDLWYLGIETDFPEQLSSAFRPKGKEINKCYRRKKKRKQNPFQKEDRSGTHHMSIEKVQDYEIYL